ncbi:MAG: ankyrin repeat domain-containing protein [bacterium]
MKKLFVVLFCGLSFSGMLCGEGVTALKKMFEKKAQEVKKTRLEEREHALRKEKDQMPEELKDLAYKGDWKGVENFFKRYAKAYKNLVNFVDQTGKTLLHHACWQGNVDAVKFLLGKAARVNAQEIEKGATPLHLASLGGPTKKINVAAEERYLDVIKQLLNKKAQINTKTKDGMTALHNASGKGLKKIVTFLIEKGALIDAQDDRGRSALHYASAMGHEGVAYYLVEKGANPELKDKGGKTAPELAPKDVGARLILTSLKKKFEDKKVSSLHLAVTFGNLNLVKKILEEGKININVQDGAGNTPLHYASRQGDGELFAYLLLKGANRGKRNNDVAIAIDLISRSDEERFSMLQRQVVKNPLFVAVGFGFMDLVRDSVEKQKVNVNKPDKRTGYTPLHVACELGNEELVKYLVEHGANITAKDNKGNTPGFYAFE